MEERKKILLIIEDDATLSRALKDAFAIPGLDVLMASDGIMGLEMAIARHPDLILLDIVLPKMNGIEMLKKLRQDSWGKGARVIILTNLSEQEKIADALESDAYEYLVKVEWELPALVKKIRALLAL